MQDQNGGLRPVARLECISIQVDAGNDSVILYHPFADIAQAGRTKNRIWQHDTHTPARCEKLSAALNEQNFRRHGGLQARGFLPNARFFVAIPNMRKLKLLKDVLVLDRYFAPKGWVGDDYIEVANRTMVTERIFIYTKGFGKA